MRAVDLVLLASVGQFAIEIIPTLIPSCVNLNRDNCWVSAVVRDFKGLKMIGSYHFRQRAQLVRELYLNPLNLKETAYGMRL